MEQNKSPLCLDKVDLDYYRSLADRSQEEFINQYMCFWPSLPAPAHSQRICIAGPMTGLPHLNQPAFMAEAAQLRSVGHHVENPAENAKPTCGTWLGNMRLAIAQLITCDRIHLLPGWTGSKGANVEYTLAKGLGLMITLAEGAESARPDSDLAFLRSGGRLTGQTYATRMGALAMLATAIDRCREIADGQETLRTKKLDVNGEATEESVCHLSLIHI